MPDFCIFTLSAARLALRFVQLLNPTYFFLSDSRSELLGCMSFGVSNIMTTEIGGWFRLLAESIGRSRHFAVRTPGGARTQRAAGTGMSARDGGLQVSYTKHDRLAGGHGVLLRM